MLAGPTHVNNIWLLSSTRIVIIGKAASSDQITLDEHFGACQLVPVGDGKVNWSERVWTNHKETTCDCPALLVSCLDTLF